MEIPSPEDMAHKSKVPNKKQTKAMLNDISKDCPNCNAAFFNGKHCYDCGSDFPILSEQKSFLS